VGLFLNHTTMGHYDREDNEPHYYTADERRDQRITSLWVKVNGLSDIIKTLCVDDKQLKSVGDVKLSPSPLKITKV